MKKKFGSLFLAVTLLANLAVPAMATSGPNSSPEIITKVTASNEIEVITDNYVTGGYLFEIGMPELRPLENINYPVIKITTLKMSSYANQKADAENPGASAGQKANIMTESALTYAKNSTVNNVATRYYNADGTGEFIDEYQMGLADRMVYNAKQKMSNYSVIQIADISTNVQARSSDQNSVVLVFDAPGVKTNSRVSVARIVDNSLEFISASAGDGTISFTVNPSSRASDSLGTFILMVYTEQ